LQGPEGWKAERELDLLLNQLAEPTQAERLLFRSRREEAAGTLFESSPNFSAGKGIRLGSAPREREEREAGEPMRSHKANMMRLMLQSAKGEDGGLEKLSILAEKLLRDPSLSEGEAAGLREFAEMARLAFRQQGKKERWTRVKLAPWCEVNLRVGKDSELSESQKTHIIKEFKRLIEDYDTRLGL
jgi:hypothetical protein